MSKEQVRLTSYANDNSYQLPARKSGTKHIVSLFYAGWMSRISLTRLTRWLYISGSNYPQTRGFVADKRLGH